MKPAAIKRFHLIIAVLSIGAAVAHVARAELLAEGAGERLWTAEIVTNADLNLPGRRTIVRVRGAGESERWRQVAEIAAPAATLTHRGTELVVLLDNGEWRLVGESGVRSGDRLPGNQPVLAIAGDDGNTLWAVGAAGDDAATTTTAPSTLRASTQPSTAATTAQLERATPATSPATRSVTTRSASPRILYRLDQGQWTPVVQLPSRLFPQTDAIAMVVIAGRPLLAGFAPDHSLRSVQLTDGDAWVDRGTIKPPIGDLRRFELMQFGGRAMLWAAGETGAGVTYELNDGWQGPIELRPPAALEPGTDRALAAAFGRLRLLYTGGDRSLSEQTFNPDGIADGPPTAGQVQARPPDPRISQFMQLAVMVLLMFVMLSTLRRRGSIQDAMRKADKLPLAPLVPRFLAGMVDALPLLAVPAFVFLTSPTLDAAKERMNDPIIQMWEGVTALTYLTYTAVAEILFARTLGKWLFGMRVTNLDGTRPTARAILLRNVMRLVDLTLALFPLIMVFLSPLRQRIGDVAAGTLVLRSGVVIPPQGPDSATTTEEP